MAGKLSSLDYFYVDEHSEGEGEGGRPQRGKRAEMVEVKQRQQSWLRRQSVFVESSSSDDLTEEESGPADRATAKRPRPEEASGSRWSMLSNLTEPTGEPLLLSSRHVEDRFEEFGDDDADEEDEEDEERSTEDEITVEEEVGDGVPSLKHSHKAVFGGSSHQRRICSLLRYEELALAVPQELRPGFQLSSVVLSSIPHLFPSRLTSSSSTSSASSTVIETNEDGEVIGKEDQKSEDKKSSEDKKHEHMKREDKQSQEGKSKDHDISSSPPWLGQLPEGVAEELRTTGRWTLHNELLLLSEYALPTGGERAAIMEETRVLQGIVQSLWPRASLVVFGSVRSGLWLPSSDLDLVVTGAPGHDVVALRELSGALRRHRFAGSLNLVAKAKVPIIKLVTRRFQVSVDISCAHNGPRQLRIIRRYMDAYAPFRPLVLVLKLVLSQHQLNEPFSGGVGSYLLTLMVASFLQHYDGYRFSSSSPATRSLVLLRSFDVSRIDLGTLLLDFLEFYSLRFNYSVASLSLLNGGRYLRKPAPSGMFGRETDRLYCRDPNDETNDVGKPSFNIDRVRDLFLYARRRLLDAVSSLSSSSPSSASTSFSILAHLIHPSFWQSRIVQASLIERRTQEGPSDGHHAAASSSSSTPSSSSSFSHGAPSHQKNRDRGKQSFTQKAKAVLEKTFKSKHWNADSSDRKAKGKGKGKGKSSSERRGSDSSERKPHKRITRKEGEALKKKRKEEKMELRGTFREPRSWRVNKDVSGGKRRRTVSYVN